MGTPPEKIPEIAVAELIDRYSVFLLDAYGVIMRGSAALPGAREFIAELDRRGKPYYVMTNDASALPSTRAKRLQGFGLPVGPDRIITSGALLRGHFEANNLSGFRCVVLGPEDSSRYVELAGGRVVPPTDDFDAIVIGDQSGFPFLETLDALMSALFHKVDRHQEVHLILPNPDLIYPKGDQGYGVASASVALVLEAALELRYPDRPDLRFVRLGKPHPAIFAEALRRSGTMDMVMMGDQLETDIRGANDFGIDSVLVDTGVSNSATEASGRLGPRPTFRMSSLES